jgi:hypothetical protein
MGAGLPETELDALDDEEGRDDDDDVAGGTRPGLKEASGGGMHPLQKAALQLLFSQIQSSVLMLQTKSHVAQVLLVQGE